MLISIQILVPAINKRSCILTKFIWWGDCFVILRGCHFKQLFHLLIKNICIKYLHYVDTKKNHKHSDHGNILCVGTLLPSVQLSLKLNSFCFLITKLPVSIVEMMISYMHSHYFFFITIVTKVSPFCSSQLQGEWTSVC